MDIIVKENTFFGILHQGKADIFLTGMENLGIGNYRIKEKVTIITSRIDSGVWRPDFGEKKIMNKVSREDLNGSGTSALVRHR